jgi:hypothetical protein
VQKNDRDTLPTHLAGETNATPSLYLEVGGPTVRH